MKGNSQNIAFEALSMVLGEGAQAARATLVAGCSTDMTLLNGEIDTMQSAESRALHLNIFADGRYGVFTTNRLRADEVRRFVAGAVKATRLLVPDRYRGLPGRSVCYDGSGFDLQTEDRAYHEVTTRQKIELIKEAASRIPDDRRLISAEIGYEDELEEELLADTEGLEVSGKRTYFCLSAECTVRDRGDARPQNWWSDGSITFRGLQTGCGARALQRAAGMTGAAGASSGRYAAVFENTCATRLVSILMDALGGSALDQRNSFLNDSLGRKLFPEGLHIYDRPHIPGMTGSSWWDGEGIATADTDIIKDGVVGTYFLGTYYARKMNLPVTVTSPSACRMEATGGGGDCGSLMRKIGRGILVTGFNGGNCNPLTGDFSYGIEGYLFENGEKTVPIKEMNFSGDMLTLWNHLALVGSDPRPHTRWQIPSLAFTECGFSGV